LWTSICSPQFLTKLQLPFSLDRSPRPLPEVRRSGRARPSGSGVGGHQFRGSPGPFREGPPDPPRDPFREGPGEGPERGPGRVPEGVSGGSRGVPGGDAPDEPKSARKCPKVKKIKKNTKKTLCIGFFSTFSTLPERVKKHPNKGFQKKHT